MKSLVTNVLRGLFVLAVTCLPSQTALAAIAFDNASSRYDGNDSPTITWSHTIGAGSNRILIVGIAAEDAVAADLVISSVKYNNVTMNLVAGSSISVGTSNLQKTELYYLLEANLPTAGAYSVTVTYAGNVSRRCAGAISLTGTDQRAREAVATNSNSGQSTISTSISTLTAGAWVVDVIGSGNTGSFTTTTGGMSERLDVLTSSSSAAAATQAVEAPGMVTMSWSGPGGRYAHSVAAFAAATEVLQHPVGDINLDWEVDWEDANILIDHWLDLGCSQANCGNLDGLGGVNCRDFALLAANWSGVFPHPRTGLVINEVMASNSGTIADDQGQYDDWIELFNNTAAAINIGGYYVTDDLNEPNKWRIPSGYPAQTTIPAHGYLLLWADDDEQDGPLHLGFQLSAGGESFGLYDSSLNLVDSIGFGDQAGDISWGPYPDASANWRYMGIPTPGARNSDGYIGLVDEVDISHLHGFYDSNFVVELSCEDEDATIRYTLNGDEPNESVGATYNPSARININGTTCLRAVALRPGWKPSVVNTATYIFLTGVKTQSDSYAYSKGFPVEWEDRWGDSVVADYAMDPTIVNDPCYSPRFTGAMKAIPTISIVTDMAHLLSPQTGIYSNPWEVHDEGNPNQDWERPISLEYFDPCTNEDFQINCGLRIAGNQSRTPDLNYKHSLRVFFKSEFGPSALEFGLYQNTGADKLNNLSLRANYHWSWLDTAFYGKRAQYLRDTFAQDTLREMGYLSPDSRHVHLYINGLYWGLYQASERPDDSFLAEHLGGQREDYDVIEGVIVGRDSNDEAIGGVELKGGQQASWDYMWGLFDGYDFYNPMNSADYTDLQRYLDVTEFVDYLVYNIFVCNWDWCAKNWYAGSTRNPLDADAPPATKWTFYTWDAEISMIQHTMYHEVPFATYYSWGPGWIHNRLHNNAAYNRLLGDRIHKLLFNSGVLTEQKGINRYEVRAEQIENAIIGESARWGDFITDIKAPGDPNYTTYTPAHWDNERDRLINPNHPLEEWWLGPFFPWRTAELINQFQNSGSYPSDSYPAPVFSQHGGEIAAGGTVTVTGSGTIKYTTNGQEPMTYGTTIASGGTVTINNSLILKARSDFGSGNWSAVNEATFAVGPVKDKLRITEMMYHPLEPADVNTEYVELKNIGTGALNLNLVKFTEGIHFTFPNMSLAVGDYVLVVQEPNAFNAKYTSGGKNVAGTYTGALANNGERIKLEDAIGRTILDFKYSDGWVDATDGDGFSINFFDADANSEPNRWKDSSNWCASKYTGGTPDVADTGLLKERSIAINEILAHTDVAPGDWIELKNTTAGAINIGGWYLSDSDETEADLKKYQIRAGTVLNAGAYLVLSYDANFGPAASDPCRLVGFGLSEFGETLYLTSAVNGVLTGFREKEDFDVSEKEVSFGRHLKSTGTYNFVAMSSKTSGAANSYPKVGPVVINEIHYNPAGGAQNLEYIELRNTTGGTVNLYDVNNVPWLFTDGIDYEFPVGTTIPANGYLLVVNTTPAYFRALYPSVPGGVTVLGPYDGKLSNAGEKLEISKPGDAEYGYQYYIRVDRVVYSDGLHPEDCPEGVDLWPKAADGSGQSLSRITPSNYGNDPGNWKAGTPSPGTANP